MTLRKRWRALGGALVVMALAVAMLPMTALANADNPNHPDYWKARYPNAIECYKHDGNSSHGKITKNGTAVRLYEFQSGWPGDRWEVLVVKGGQNGREVYELPKAGVDYHPPKNDNGKYPEVSHWIICKGKTPDQKKPIADPIWKVKPETMVCDPKTGQYVGQADGRITFVPFDHGSWNASNLTGLSAGTYGPFTAKADKGYVFQSTGTGTFSTGKIQVGQKGSNEPCDKLVTAVTPKVKQSQECGVEGKLIIPKTEGVRYLLNGDVIAAGVHSGPISGTLTAEALDGYRLSNPDFSVEIDIPAADPCPVVVTPVAPELVEAQECGVPDRLVVPETGGVVYLLNGEDVSGETLEGPLSGTIVAEAADGHVLSEDLIFDFTLEGPEPCPVVVTPVAPELVEAQECGVPDRLVVPETGGVVYLLNGEDVSGETLEGPLSGTIVAEAADGHVLSEDLAYDFTLKAATPCPQPEDEPTDDPKDEPDPEVGEETTTTTTTPEKEEEVDPEVEDESTATTVPDDDDDPETDDETEDTLPFTGLGTGNIAAVALAALAAGGGLLLMSRRRPEESTD